MPVVPRCFPCCDRLESRRLLSAVYPTNVEQYLVELINRGRANPAAEASRYGINLNEGLAAGTISTAAKQPLAINPNLTDGARSHSQWMIDTDNFSHSGAGNSSPGDRMKSAGYVFSGSWAWGENIAYRSGSAGTSLTATLHKDLFVDAGIADRGHRTNLMNANFREIGAGEVAGQFGSYNVEMITEDFAKSGSGVFLTGVAYKDSVTKDNFYTPGEGLAGVTITAKKGDGTTYKTTTWSTGGYSLPVSAGTYTVTASGGALTAPISYGSVSVGSENVKRDFIPSGTGTPPPADTKAPTATLTRAKPLRTAGGKYYNFVVTYADNVAVDPASFGDGDLIISGPGGYSRIVNFYNADFMTPGTPRTVNYMVKGPGNLWDAADNGVYTISIQSNQIADTSGNKAAVATVGEFLIRIPATPAVAPAAAPAVIASPGTASMAIPAIKRADSDSLLS